MGFLYKRRGSTNTSKFWWIRYKAADGELVADSTGTTDKRKAQRILDKIERRTEAGLAITSDGAPVTVRRYAERWLEERRRRGIATVKDDKGRLHNHLLPRIGPMKLEDVKPRHIQNLVRALKTSEDLDLAPRTIINIYGVMHVLFKDAVADELIDATPCVLKSGDLPKKKDKDPRWRPTARFTRDETETLLSDERVPHDRRILYALQVLAGLRFGEASALKWADYDTAIKPLNRLSIIDSYSTNLKKEKDTKTECTREVPVHPILAAMLARWRRNWAEFYGRAPADTDLIVPSRRGKNRSRHHGLKKLHDDLERLKFRRRRQHDLRRTFTSIARDDGADVDRLKWITHGRTANIMDVYTDFEWKTLCDEVAKIRLNINVDPPESPQPCKPEPPRRNCVKSRRASDSQVTAHIQAPERQRVSHQNTSVRFPAPPPCKV